jgi:nitrogen regulatory protein P-II 1
MPVPPDDPVRHPPTRRDRAGRVRPSGSRGYILGQGPPWPAASVRRRASVIVVSAGIRPAQPFPAGNPTMKKIDAIIRPSKLDEVKAALAEVGVQGMTVTEVKGFGRTGGRHEVYRGSSYVVDFVPKVRVEVIAPDDLAASIVEAVLRSASTGKIGDGKVFISDVVDAVRIRTGQHGEDAI